MLGLGMVVAGLVLAACTTRPPTPAPAAAGDGVEISASDPALRLSGRSEGVGTADIVFGYSGARMRLRFEGPSVAVRLEDESRANYAMAWVDGRAGRKFRLDAPDGLYPLAQGLAPGEHTVEVVRVTECDLGLTHFRGFVLGPGGRALAWRDGPERRIEFIGDSITCGYGVEVDDPKLHFEPATENFCLGYSGLAARRLDADYLVVSRSGIGIVRNYDGPREGSEHAMPEVYPATFYLKPGRTWDAAKFTPDVVCVNLGTNDFSTTGVNVDSFTSAYVSFGTMLLQRYPRAQLVIIQGPMNNDAGLRAALDAVVRELGGRAAGRVHFLALSAQGSVGLGADYHPNRAQSEINARELTTFLADLMGWR